MQKTIAFIMAGGKGVRLGPLTKHRTKPAVPFGGKYRLIDFVLSNFINSGIYSIFVLTQFKSQSLMEHLREGWDFGFLLSDHFVIPVPAQMRVGTEWYQGTADAVYQNLNLAERKTARLIAVFGADHIYKMDVSQMVEYHEKKQADATVAVIPVSVNEASQYGVVEIDNNWKITGFHEKPKGPPSMPGQPDLALVSMGNYIFSRDLLAEELEKDSRKDTAHDFGQTILPAMCRDRNVFAYDFRENRIPRESESESNYWRDVGTIDSYWEANMDLKGVYPTFNLYNRQWPIRTVSDLAPPAKFVQGPTGGMGEAINSLISEGCIISGGLVKDCVIGRNIFVGNDAEVIDSILMDNVVVGDGVKISKAVIDKNVRIGPGLEIGFDLEKDRKKYFVTDSGIIVIEKGTKLPKSF